MVILKARTEFALALNQVCHERGIEPEVVLESIKEAVLAAFRKDFGLSEEQEYAVEINPETGETKIFSQPETKKGKKKEVTPPGFGRIAAQVAKQVILQKIREAEKDVILTEYGKRVGTLVNGMVLRFDGANVILDIGKTEGLMPPEEQVRTEHYRFNQRLTLLVKDIRETVKGRRVIVSRSDAGLIEGLFRREVPEVASGAVEIKAIAREAGARSKVAVVSTQPGVDPVGSCVGQKGVRVQAVIGELEGEKIDIVPYSEDLGKLIVSALAPAENIKLTLDSKKKQAVVEVPDDQLSLAIGKEGQNVRLAAKLTGLKIDIKGAKSTAAGQKKTDEPAKPSELGKFDFSSRVVKALEKAGIKTEADLREKNRKDLTAVKGIGPRALEAIEKSLNN
ncbi:MAG: transcription termination/antitermination protein NusA [Candidatus Pacebacteria bacterium]|nr:transcription termination/antitermination protein NusA [Candidatus Paceibacterota bacterium]